MITNLFISIIAEAAPANWSVQPCTICSDAGDGLYPFNSARHGRRGNRARVAKMNLAVHGLEGKIAEAITYYQDEHSLAGKCDFVMANPPFNVDLVDAERIKGDPRLPFGLPGMNKQKKVGSGRGSLKRTARTHVLSDPH